jgi:hypothetical protein
LFNFFSQLFSLNQKLFSFSSTLAPLPPPVMAPPMAGTMGRGPPPDGRPGLNNGLNEQIPKHSVTTTISLQPQLLTV